MEQATPARRTPVTRRLLTCGIVAGPLFVTEALRAGLVDELVLHQVPVLLGAGRPYFQELPDHIQLRLLDVVPAPGVTHLHYEIQRPDG